MADGGENIRIHLGRESMDRTTITDMTLERYIFGKTKFIKYPMLLTILLTLAHNTLFFLIDTLSSSHFTLYSYLCIFCFDYTLFYRLYQGSIEPYSKYKQLGENVCRKSFPSLYIEKKRCSLPQK